MKAPAAALISVAISASSALRASQPAGSCDALRALKLPHTTITLAEAVDAGKLNLQMPGGGTPPAALIASLPAFCRVAASIAPTADSNIKIEVWMPADGWNGKLEGVGNGGWAGTINYPLLLSALRRGYAAASTDTGHAGGGGDGSFALDHP